ncbi:MAG: DUF1232 domain-containing protein [Acidobacteriota bacterium]
MTEHEQQPMSDDDILESTALAESVDFAEELDDELPSSGLLSFYDRLRSRMVRFVEKKGGKVGPAAADALLLVPDVFILLVRLALDKDVPKEKRALIGSALAYFLLPIDLLPEAIVGPVGYVDDLVLGLSVLSQAFGRDLDAFTAKYWSGSKSLHSVLRDVVSTADSLLSQDIFEKLRRTLSEQGIDLDAMRAEAADDDPVVSPV